MQNKICQIGVVVLRYFFFRTWADAFSGQSVEFGRKESRRSKLPTEMVAAIVTLQNLPFVSKIK